MNDGLKQRLIGALVLAGVGVIFLPGLFRESSTYPVDTRSQIPLSPEVESVVIEPPKRLAEVLPSPEPDTMFLPESEQPVHEAPEELIAAAEATPDKAPPVSPEPSADEDVLAAAPPEPAEEDALIPGAWVVQVASLSSEESARRLRDKLQERGYKAYIRRVNNGELNRVFIGPKFERETALSIKREIDPVYKVNALVLQFKP